MWRKTLSFTGRSLALLAVHIRKEYFGSVAKIKLPSWTWWLPFPIILSSKIISQFSFQQAGVHFVYLPHILGSALFFWWGARIIPAYFLAEMLTASLSGATMWALSPVFGTISTCKAFMGYFLFSMFARKEEKSGYRYFILFFFWVILIPNVVCNYLIFAQFVAVGRYDQTEFSKVYLFINIADFIGGLLVTYPLVTYLSPWLKIHRWSQWPPKRSETKNQGTNSDRNASNDLHAS